MFAVEGAVDFCGGRRVSGCLHLFSLAQVGDGTWTHRYTPVSVAGLSSGVAMVALGGVRSGCDLFACLTLARERVCGLFSFL